MIPITNPHKLLERFDGIDALFNKLEPYSTIPKALSSALLDVLQRWNDAYGTKNWGLVESIDPRGARWTEEEQTEWNVQLNNAERLVAQAAATPGVKVTERKEGPVGPVLPMPDILITGKVPSFWYFGLGAAALAVAFTYMSKKRSESTGDGMSDLFKIKYQVGTYEGTKDVNADDEEQAVSLVKRWARKQTSTPMYYEDYRVVDRRKLNGEDSRYIGLPRRRVNGT